MFTEEQFLVLSTDSEFFKYLKQPGEVGSGTTSPGN